MKELEERGIGRPSTYARVIETIVNKRDYVWKKGTALVPTWTAFAKVQLLERHFAHLIDYEFTAIDGGGARRRSRVARAKPRSGSHRSTSATAQVGLAGAGVPRSTSPRSTRPTSTRSRVGHDADGNALIVRVWPNGANIERGDDKAPIPADLAPDELTPEQRRGAARQGAARAA